MIADSLSIRSCCGFGALPAWAATISMRSTGCAARRASCGRTEIVGDGDGPDRVHVLIDGWACRVRLLADGNRQITVLLLPGDICDLETLSLHVTRVTVTTLTQCTIVSIERAALRALQAGSFGVGAALGWGGAVESAMMAEHIASIGRRSAHNHLAHLCCVLLIRLTIVGHAKGTGFPLPITRRRSATCSVSRPSMSTACRATCAPKA